MRHFEVKLEDFKVYVVTSCVELLWSYFSSIKLDFCRVELNSKSENLITVKMSSHRNKILLENGQSTILNVESKNVNIESVLFYYFEKR